MRSFANFCNAGIKEEQMAEASAQACVSVPSGPWSSLQKGFSAWLKHNLQLERPLDMRFSIFIYCEDGSYDFLCKYYRNQVPSKGLSCIEIHALIVSNMTVLVMVLWTCIRFYCVPWAAALHICSVFKDESCYYLHQFIIQLLADMTCFRQSFKKKKQKFGHLKYLTSLSVT
jgi:hypothetical protein